MEVQALKTPTYCRFRHLLKHYLTTGLGTYLKFQLNGGSGTYLKAILNGGSGTY